jgi:beta-lactamase class A
MKRNSAIYLSILAIVMTGCSRSAITQERATNAARTDNSNVKTLENAAASDLQRQISEVAAVTKGRVGVSAIVLETGDTGAFLNAKEHFPMQSVYKLPISMAVMKRVDEKKLSLNQNVIIAKDNYIGRAAHSPIRDRFPNGTEMTVSELLRFALSESDGTASDILMILAGGPGAVQAYLSELGITDLKVMDTEKAFAEDHSLQFRNWASPEAAVALLRVLHEKRGISESSQALLLKYMIESRPGAKRLKGLLPEGTIVAHKTGTSGTEKGITAATNDIGIITLRNGKHLAIAVFVSDSPADEATREGVIAKIAKLAVDSLSQ